MSANGTAAAIAVTEFSDGTQNMCNDHGLIGWRFVVGNNCYEHLKGAINGVCMLSNNNAGLAILQL